MQFAPDGRLFVCEQGGRLRVIKNGVLLSHSLSYTHGQFDRRTRSARRRLRSQFRRQPVRVCLLHGHQRQPCTTGSAGSPPTAMSHRLAAKRCSSISRTSARPTTTAAPSRSAPDGKLYIAVGENAVSSNAQSLNNRLGKMLRVNPDGSIPTDNPFYTTASGTTAPSGRWACAIRLRLRSTPPARDMFINDVGQGTWEEINDGVAGANYGWPTTEGPTDGSAVRRVRVIRYAHAGGVCAITGGAFYTPATVQYPSDYVGDYFFADYCGGWIRKIEPANGNPVTLRQRHSSPVDLKVSATAASTTSRADRLDDRRRVPDRVRRLARRASHRIRRAGPSRREHPSRSASGQRARAAANTSGSATASTSAARPRRTTPSPRSAPADNGARFRAVVSATPPAASRAARRC